jgi:hypothetical protein
MRPVRVLTVCVGISEYRSAVLESGEEPLKYLAQGAKVLSACFRDGWPDTHATHFEVTDEAATLNRVQTLLHAQSGSYDLFVLYLGGHGRFAASEFRFVFFGDNSEQCVAPSRVIDSLLVSVNSTCTLMLLDACFAGQYGAESQFFNGAASAVAIGERACIASSHASQKSWEDPQFRRSLFVDALLRALTADSNEREHTFRPISSIYVRIAADVTRHAFALKGSASQEPVIFGSREPTFELPLIRGALSARSMTTYQILRLRVRQIMVALVAFAALTLTVISAATWRPAFDASGFIELRQGPKWLSALNVGPWATRVETDVTERDIKASQEDPGLK